MSTRKAVEFSFSWIFALIVGASILFFAIYAATKLISTEKNIDAAEAGKQFGIILNPFETGVEEGKSAHIAFSQETRVYAECIASAPFGEQSISIATRSGVGKAWSEPGVASTFSHKYLFAASTLEGTSFTVFSKQFEFPFKIADVVYIIPSSVKYCMINAPYDVENDLTSLGIEAVEFVQTATSCPAQSTRVCFTSTGCDIDVNLGAQTVKKFKQTLYFASSDRSNALLYGALFSDPGVYECQVKRLSQRMSELASVYQQTSALVAPRGCTSGLEGSLLRFSNVSFSLKTSVDLKMLETMSEDIRRSNNVRTCKLF